MSFERNNIRRALIVEDEDLPRWTLRRVLEEAGWEVTEASGCEEAAEIWAGGGFDLVVTDYRLGDGLGTELVARLRGQGSAVRVILLSAEFADQGHSQGPLAELGLDAVLRKPVEPARFREAVLAIAGPQPAAETGLERRRAGRFVLATLTGGIAVDTVAAAVAGLDDGAWVALDCRAASGVEAGAADALASLAGRLRSGGGGLCLLGLTGEARSGLETVCREQGIDQAEAIEELDAVGRRLVSRREREQVLGSVVRA